MKKLIQTWFLLDDNTTWGEMFRLAALSVCRGPDCLLGLDRWFNYFMGVI
jgi:hypothetical protein